jgi:replicative superfamily II helicase
VLRVVLLFLQLIYVAFFGTPAHLVIVKGTEYFDGKTSRYVDYPLTDVLQMIGRAGRPGYSEEGKAVVMAMEAKKNFYKVRIGSLLSVHHISL